VSWRLPLVVLIAGMFMAVLDITIINVAVTTIQNEFGETTDDAQWVVTAYSLAEGVVVPVSAWLGDRLGLKRVYLVALLGFGGGSALCGLAWGLDSLVTFRIVQGLLGGILPAITMSILLRIVPRDRLGAALGMYGLGVVTAPAVGPALGGYLVEYVDWRLIFFINVPVAVLGAVAAVLVLPRFETLPGRRFDVLGFITVASGLFALLLALSEGEDWGWDSYSVLGLFTFSALSLALFVVIELEVDDPLLDLRVFRHWAFTNSLLLIGLVSVVLFTVVFYVPLFLQAGQGLEAFDAGLVLLPPALAMAVLMPISGQIYDRIGPRWPAVIGLMVAAIGTYLLSTITLYTPREDIIWFLVVYYAGLGIGMMPIFSAGLAVIPNAETNAASALNNVVQRTSGAFGVAVFTAIYTNQQGQLMAGRAAVLPANTPAPDLGPTAPPEAGLYAIYQQAQLEVLVGSAANLFLIAAGICVVGALGAILLRSGPARAAAPAAGAPPQQAATAPPSTDGKVAVQRELTPSTVSDGAKDGSPARPDSKQVGDATRLPPQ
jgi:EmrB/QacA subfamily drug resistance transporter